MLELSLGIDEDLTSSILDCPRDVFPIGCLASEAREVDRVAGNDGWREPRSSWD